eukprot:Awhi_evm1s15569
MDSLQFALAKNKKNLNLSQQWTPPEEESDFSRSLWSLLQNTSEEDLQDYGWFLSYECKKRVSSYEGLMQLISFLKENKVLRILLLCDNYIDDKGIDILLPALKGYDSLTELVLKGNRIGSKGAEKLSTFLRENQSSLVQLILGSNDIGIEGAKHIGLALEQNTTLAKLSLNDNKILAE